MQISVREYGRMVGKSRHTIYRWIKDEALPPGVRAKMIADHLVIEIVRK